MPCCYDTWSQRDENGLDLSNRQLVPLATNRAPYPFVFPLIQIKIRAIEPKTTQTREITIVVEM